MAGSASMGNLIPIEPGKSISVNEFYKGRHIFITGGTGFMGKVLIEKLLWSTQDLGVIYLLIRPKNGKCVKERLKKLFQLKMFDRLRNRDEKIFSKVVPIVGDVSEINLGLSDEDKKLLEDTVSIVFHAASSVRFNDSLKKIITINIRGTREVVNISKAIKNLQVLVYVSTAFCKTDKKIIEEKIYISDLDWRTAIKSTEVLDEKSLNSICHKLIGSHPNTYAFSKLLAENIIWDHRNILPVLIYRPSIVTYSLKEPIRGYIESFNGPMGMVTGVLTGVVHTMKADEDVLSDYIPCDYAINGLIVSAWYKGVSNSKACDVVNAAAGKTRFLSANKTMKVILKSFELYPVRNMMYYPWIIVTNNNFIYNFLFLITHLLPAFVLDFWAKLKGSDFSLTTLYKKVYIANMSLLYFLTTDWHIMTDNFKSLTTFLSPSEKEIYNFDMDLFTIEDLNCILFGIKTFLLNEDTSKDAIKKDIKKVKKLYWIDRILKGIFLVLLGWYIFQYTSNCFASKLFY